MVSTNSFAFFHNLQTEQDAIQATPALYQFVDQWLASHSYDHARSCLHLLEEKRRGQFREDGKTPAILHELSQACYTIALIQNNYHLADPETLLCLNLTHDLGEEFSLTASDLCDHFKQKPGDPNMRYKPWQETVSQLFSRMAKKINGRSLFPAADGSGKTDHRAYFMAMIDNPLTAIAKFQDRIHNMATMIGVKPLEKQREYLEETLLLRDVLIMARDKFPAHKSVFTAMHSIINTQIFFVARYHGLVDPVASQNLPLNPLPRMRRIKELPAGLDPLIITQNRALQASPSLVTAPPRQPL